MPEVEYDVDGNPLRPGYPQGWCANCMIMVVDGGRYMLDANPSNTESVFMCDECAENCAAACAKMGWTIRQWLELTHGAGYVPFENMYRQWREHSGRSIFSKRDDDARDKVVQYQP